MPNSVLILYLVLAASISIFPFFGLITMSIAAHKGRSKKWFWMGFFLSFVGIIVVSVLPNLSHPSDPNSLTKNCTKRENKQTYSKVDKFEEIRKYKELLDDGIITQEEFDYKKKEIL